MKNRLTNAARDRRSRLSNVLFEEEMKLDQGRHSKKQSIAEMSSVRMSAIDFCESNTNRMKSPFWGDEYL